MSPVNTGRIVSMFSSGATALKAAGYFLFFLLSLLVFMYARFPSEGLIALAKKAVDGHPVKLAISDASLTFPPGVRLDDVTVIQPSPGKIREVVKIDSVLISPSILSAVTGGVGGDVSARLLGGDITLHGDAAGGGDIRLNVRMDDINPGLLNIWDEFPWGKLEGLVSAEGRLDVKQGDMLKGAGDAAIGLKNGAITLSGPLFKDPPRIAIDSGTLKLDYDNGRLVIAQGELNGPELYAAVSGDIILAKSPQYSRLNIKASIRLSGALKEKFGPFAALLPQENGNAVIRLGGTLQEPSMR